jgi:hypothetical protein
MASGRREAERGAKRSKRRVEVVTYDRDTHAIVSQSISASEVGSDRSSQSCTDRRDEKSQPFNLVCRIASMRLQCSVLPIPCFRHYSFCCEAASVARSCYTNNAHATDVSCMSFVQTSRRVSIGLLLCIQSKPISWKQQKLSRHLLKRPLQYFKDPDRYCDQTVH